MAQVIPLIITIAAAAATTVSAIKQGQNAQAAADFNGRVANQNAEAAKQQGIAARAAADRQNRQRLGNMKTEFGSSGLDSDSGSALDILQSSASQGKLEAANVGYAYQMKALGYSNQGLLAGMESDAAGSQMGWTASAALLKSGVSIYSEGDKLAKEIAKNKGGSIK